MQKKRVYRLLDLYCGAGGAAMGYHRTGMFEIIGVDNKPQPRYPFKFFLGDALEWAHNLADYADFIHASPPCQKYSKAAKGRFDYEKRNYPDLVGATRKAIEHKPYIIENVPGAPLIDPVQLCGTHFHLWTGDLYLRRHRLFESNLDLVGTGCYHPKGFYSAEVYGNGPNSFFRKKFGRSLRVAEKQQVMGIDWMIIREINEAIPPAYTEYLGRQVIECLKKLQKD